MAKSRAEKIQVTSFRKKIPFGEGVYNKEIISIIGNGVNFTANDYSIETSGEDDINSYIVWNYPKIYTIGNNSPVLPLEADFTNKTQWVADSTTPFLSWTKNEAGATNGGFVSVIGGVKCLMGWDGVGQRTEYSNNICADNREFPLGETVLAPYFLEISVEPESIAIGQERGLFTGEGVIYYGTPFDFIGIGGYGPGCVDSCPAPAGTGGAFTQEHNYEGEGMLIPGTNLRAFQVSSTPEGVALVINNMTATSPIVVTTAINHGYTTGDVVYLEDVTGTDYVDNRGYKITVTGVDTFSIPVDGSIATAPIAPFGTVDRLIACDVTYFNGPEIPTDRIKLRAVYRDSTIAFWANVSGKENGWVSVGPLMTLPRGWAIEEPDSGVYHDTTNLIIGSYMGGFNKLSGSAGPFTPTEAVACETTNTLWKILTGEGMYYPDPLGAPPDYNPIPILTGD